MLQKTLDLTALLDINQFVHLQREFNLHLTTEIKELLELLSVCVLVSRQFASRSQVLIDLNTNFARVIICVFIISSFAAIRFTLAMFMFGITEAQIYFSFVNNNSFWW